jgi:dTMP kinase
VTAVGRPAESEWPIGRVAASRPEEVRVTPSARGARANHPGLLVAFEGGDGCGKSTQAARLRDALIARDVPVGPLDDPGAVVREPGGTEAGEAIRAVLLHGPEALTPWTEALLYAAARAELVARVLQPALAAGRVVLLDRFVDSSLAYQGHARGLGIDEVLALNGPGLRGVLPDVTFVLEVEPAVGLARAGETPDRIEREGVEFQTLVRDGFREVARRFPERVRLLDGGRPVADLAAEIASVIGRLLRDETGPRRAGRV